MRAAAAFLAGLVVAATAGAALLLAEPALRARLLPGAAVRGETVVAATLEAVRREQKLLVFAAWVTADVTSTVQKTFLDLAVPGTAITRTLIVPGEVRYAIDLSALTDADLGWNQATRTLTVRMPPVEPLDPVIRLERMRIYTEKGLLAAVTGVEQMADEMNRKAIARELMAQARTPELMRLAEAAGAEALRNSFLLPLRAAGLEGVSVEVVRPAAREE
ncbi:DUF4230 domain-containing protein [Thermaurantiacus tibetensis]|uniref:DUF4230 domain-containing protein n=1 Tax=Thermaurantiacus tibetensis TaxID=2759035 RepID=UPI00188F617C|nr:DUF4230 domain-containing protein [Thermaurantiacus tibetensis]